MSALILLLAFNFLFSINDPLTFEEANILLEKSVEWSPDLVQKDTNIYYKIDLSRIGLVYNAVSHSELIFFGQNFISSCELEFQPMIREQIDFNFLPHEQVHQRWRKENSNVEYIKLENKSFWDFNTLTPYFEAYLVFHSKELKRNILGGKDCEKSVDLFELRKVLVITIDYRNKIIQHSKEFQNEKFNE